LGCWRGGGGILTLAALHMSKWGKRKVESCTRKKGDNCFGKGGGQLKKDGSIKLSSENNLKGKEEISNLHSKTRDRKNCEECRRGQALGT